MCPYPHAQFDRNVKQRCGNGNTLECCGRLMSPNKQHWWPLIWRRDQCNYRAADWRWVAMGLVKPQLYRRCVPARCLHRTPSVGGLAHYLLGTLAFCPNGNEDSVVLKLAIQFVEQHTVSSYIPLSTLNCCKHSKWRISFACEFIIVISQY